jgi:hypothetical protein
MLSTFAFNQISDVQRDNCQTWRQCREPLDYAYPVMVSTALSVTYLANGIFAMLESIAMYAGFIGFLGCEFVTGELFENPPHSLSNYASKASASACFNHYISITAAVHSWIAPISSGHIEHDDLAPYFYQLWSSINSFSDRVVRFLSL